MLSHFPAATTGVTAEEVLQFRVQIMRSVELHGRLGAVGALVSRSILGNRKLPGVRRPDASRGVAGKHDARGSLAVAVQFCGQTFLAHVEQLFTTIEGLLEFNCLGDPHACSIRRTATSSRWTGTSCGAEMPNRTRLPRVHCTTSTTMSRPIMIRSPSLLLKTSMALAPLFVASAPELATTSSVRPAGEAG